MSTKLHEEELRKLRTIDFTKQPGFVDAESVLSKVVGKQGSNERETFNAKAQSWYYGTVLKARRKELHLTQKDIATRIGKERSYISRIEKGETDMQLSSFLQIANALNLCVRMEVHGGD